MPSQAHLELSAPRSIGCLPAAQLYLVPGARATDHVAAVGGMAAEESASTGGMLCPCFSVRARPPCARRGLVRVRELASAAAWGRWTRLSVRFPANHRSVRQGQHREEGWLVRTRRLSQGLPGAPRAIGLARSCLGRLDMFVGSLNASRGVLSGKYRVRRAAGQPRAAGGSGVGLSPFYGLRRRRHGLHAGPCAAKRRSS